MASLADLKKNKRQLTVEYDGITVNFEFRPNEYTPEVEDLLKEPKGALQTIGRLVTSWDLLEKPNGKPVPLTVDGLNVVPSALLNVMIDAMATDLAPKSKAAANGATAKGSFTGSSDG